MTPFELSRQSQMRDAAFNTLLHAGRLQILAGGKKMPVLPENPWITDSRAADHNAVTAGFQHRLHIIVGVDVPVTDQRNRNDLFDLGKPIPIGITIMGHGPGTAMD